MSTVGTRLHTFQDASGLVTVAVFSAGTDLKQEHWINEEILVGDGDMVAVGGGGTATDFPAGAFLTASFPNDDLSGWVVSSKDYEVPNPHHLMTYVIGMKIAGMSRQQLLDSIHVSRADSGEAPNPWAVAGIPSDEFVPISGGFRVDWHHIGNLATACFPETAGSWKALSSSHIVSDPSNLRVFAICLRRNLPVGPVTVAVHRAFSGVTVSHPAAVAFVPPGFALTGGGAQVDNLGNFLWMLQPAIFEDPTFSAASKDHLLPRPSTITAYALGIRIG
jgi:hypothetical protein